MGLNGIILIVAQTLSVLLMFAMVLEFKHLLGKRVSLFHTLGMERTGRMLRQGKVIEWCHIITTLIIAIGSILLYFFN